MPIVWRGRRARAFVPTLLAERDLELGAETVSLAARARASVEHGAESMPEDYAALARLLLRAEGVASSFIEGVTAPVVDIVLAEAGNDDGSRGGLGRREPGRGDGGARRSARWPAHRRQPVPVAPDADDGQPDAVAPRRCRPGRTGMDRRDLATRRAPRDAAARARTGPPRRSGRLRQPDRRRPGEPSRHRPRAVRGDPPLRRRERPRRARPHRVDARSSPLTRDAPAGQHAHRRGRRGLQLGAGAVPPRRSRAVGAVVRGGRVGRGSRASRSWSPPCRSCGRRGRSGCQDPGRAGGAFGATPPRGERSICFRGTSSSPGRSSLASSAFR